MEEAYTKSFIHQEGSFEFDATRYRKSMEFSRSHLFYAVLQNLCCVHTSKIADMQT